MKLHFDRRDTCLLPWKNDTWGDSRRTFGIHIDFPWSEDVLEYDAPKRVYIHLIWWSIVIGLDKNGASQIWHHRDGNIYKWRRITWHPNRMIQCRQKYYGTKVGRSNGPREWECARLRGHRGEHA